MELVPLAKVRKLAGKDCLDMRRLPRQNVADPARERDLDAVGALGGCPVEEAVEIVKQAVLHLLPASIYKEAHAFDS
jgi:hypothetical protein